MAIPRVSLFLFLAVTVLAWTCALPSYAAEAQIKPATVVFVVAWYDVGKATLEGLPGVLKVEKGFKFFKEINTVWYDPARISIPDMEHALQQAGTYKETLP